MSESPLISVIVPVYKVEKYLRKCIDSIVAQSYSNLEIILVDDGSPDGCPEICEKYAAIDKRIRVIHKENGGPASARNMGIDIARGSFFSFVDADDYLFEDLLERLLDETLKTNAELSICNLLLVDEEGEKIDEYLEHRPVSDRSMTGIDAMHAIYSQYGYIYVMPQGKLYNRKLFNGLRYPDGKYAEDEFIIHHIYMRCERIACVSRAMYYYVQRAGSLTQGEFRARNIDAGEALLARYRDLRSCGDSELIRKIGEQACGLMLKYDMLRRKYLKKDNDIKKRLDSLITALWNETGHCAGYSLDIRCAYRMYMFSPFIYGVMSVPGRWIRRLIHRGLSER